MGVFTRFYCFFFILFNIVPTAFRSRYVYMTTILKLFSQIHSICFSIRPHATGGFSLPKTLDNIVDIFAHNLKRYAAGLPLDNQMDRRTQYASGARLQSTL